MALINSRTSNKPPASISQRARETSPHTLGQNSTQRVMALVIMATVPALVAQTIFFGWGTLINVIWCSLIAMGCEALVMTLRKRPVSFYLKDYSALVTGLLLGLALPPFAPFWISLVAVSFAMIIAKHLYGGLGQNPFNPAMVGYVLVLISFPQEMTSWLPPLGVEGYNNSLSDALFTIFPFGQGIEVDAISTATVLDVMRENKSLTMDELWAANPVFDGFAGRGWMWVNLAYLAGGVFLIWRKVFTWHAPVGMLAAIAVMAFLFWGGTGSDSHGSPVFHLLSGATMLGAFFIITDPVSGATSNRGRLIFGAGVGIMVYVIRAWGGYPDGVAFATLLMNMAAPTIDYYTQPRTYGHNKANKGLPGKD
ncbi:electron transport complex subunit RsxD [uncultured Endozoicomonas sp.]|uniref:electron transport complex subunit RsxD n=1 Tax=uncultured Endozoicomonas sp. TaxID=432652 RepID=UPI002627259A|nr:electron transport complex subunit RsxD [uncultured Endozoicomonas sp.]